jgi:hypothetical protein
MATLSLARFRAEFPEFEDASDALAQAKLDEAHRAFDEALFGARYLDAVRYKAATLIASSPFGKSMRLAKGEGATVYAEPLETILRAVPASGVAVE